MTTSPWALARGLRQTCKDFREFWLALPAGAPHLPPKPVHKQRRFRATPENEKISGFQNFFTPFPEETREIFPARCAKSTSDAHRRPYL
jgi:hypothetical protein